MHCVASQLAQRAQRHRHPATRRQHDNWTLERKRQQTHTWAPLGERQLKAKAATRSSSEADKKRQRASETRPLKLPASSRLNWFLALALSLSLRFTLNLVSHCCGHSMVGGDNLAPCRAQVGQFVRLEASPPPICAAGRSGSFTTTTTACGPIDSVRLTWPRLVCSAASMRSAGLTAGQQTGGSRSSLASLAGQERLIAARLRPIVERMMRRRVHVSRSFGHSRKLELSTVLACWLHANDQFLSKSRPLAAGQ